MEPQTGLPSNPQPQLKEDIAAVTANTYTIDTFGTIIFFVVLVQIILLVGLNLYQKSRISSANKTLAAKQTLLQTANYKTINDEVNQVLSGNTLLASALSSKVDWGKFYSQLNAVTPKNVQLTTLSITDAGQFKADGKTASLDSLAKALVVWQQGQARTPTPFSTVTLATNGFTAATSGSRQVTFSISGQINLGVLR
ncbi:MAG TPA: hypothetical protein VLE93_02225 [Candidatus Saccharimonadales bacterium]|nr:hypothetical protein [Candidatus Saccharimonadales bacterium]